MDVRDGRFDGRRRPVARLQTESSSVSVGSAFSAGGGVDTALAAAHDARRSLIDTADGSGVVCAVVVVVEVVVEGAVVGSDGRVPVLSVADMDAS
ncbi:hypothetical protein [Streptomyces niveus]|uniref:hypothetical protein n=1 Tax=Streptomyces niveus TaxID=193462 RepID=UPI00341C44A4